MLDFVLNHASFRNPLIQKALCASITGKPSRAKELVITFSQRPSAKELRTVARPRFTPLLTPYSVYQKRRKIFAVLGSPPPRSHVLGRGWVWTTFSRPPHPNGTTATTQVDFNFSSPHTFAALLPALRKLLESGAGWLRFDAVGYLWKAPGCTSLHEPETFKLLEAWRAVTHYWRPGARLVAEVNEPQDTLLRYLGTPSNPRADFVYQFAAFPLAVHAIQRGHVLYFRRWLKSLSRFRGRQIVTVLGTHDGMSLKPLARWLPAREQQWLLNLLRRNHQAQPNFARLPGGKKIAYEICGTPWNLINPPRSTARTPLALPRYLAVLHLGLLVRGIPCLYANGLWGSPHYQPRGGLDENRTINRQRFPYSSFLRAWQNPRHHFGQVGREVLRLFSLRQQLPHFHPFAPPPQILPAPPSVLAALLPPPRKGKALLTLINVTKKTTEVKIKLPSPILRDVIHGEKFTSPTRHASIPLKPYQARWLISA
jgi:sucrose phosphorylase